MSDAIGYVPLQIIPSMQGIGGNLTAGFAPFVSAGRQAGQDAGRAAASGVEAARGDVEKASSALAKARDKEADAAGKVRVAEEKVNELRERGITSGSQYTAAVERLATANRNALRTTEAVTRAQNDHAAAEERAANATDDAEQSTSRFREGLGRFSSSIDDNAKRLGAMAIAAAGVGSAMELANQAIAADSQNNLLTAQLGLDPAESAMAGQLAGELWSQNFGGSMEDVNTAISAVASTLGNFTDDGSAYIGELTKSAIVLSDTFGVDVAESTQTVNNMIRNGFAKDGVEAFDLLAKGMQSVPAAMRGEILPVMDEYAVSFAAAGMSGRDAMGVVVNAAQGGQIAMDKAGDSIKEFIIRATDIGDVAAQDAIKGLGLDATQMATDLLAGGEAAGSAFNQIVGGLQKIESPTEQAAASVAIFGTPLEDLSKNKIPEFLGQLGNGASAIGDFEGTTSSMGATLTEGPAAGFESLKRSLQGGLMEGLESAATWVQNNIGVAQGLAVGLGVLAAAYVAARVAAVGYAVGQGIAAVASGSGAAALAGNTIALGAYTIASGIARGATAVATGVQWAFNAALSANPIGLIVIAITALVGGLIWFFTQTEIGQKIVTGAWNAIKTGWDWLYGALSTGISAVGDALGWMGDKAGEVKDWIVGKRNDMVGFVTSLPGKISSAAAGMWDGIQNAFKGAINWIIRAWNSLEFRIPGFSVGPVKWDGFTLGLPDLPYFRDGGPVSGPGTSRSDSILARLSNGEFVVPARGVNDATMPLLEAIRGGWVPSPGFLHAMVGGFGALATRGEYDGALSKVGIEEDHPIVSGVLDLRSLLGFADGGLVTADQLNKFPRENGLEGAVYDWGGVNWGDCSGAMSALANFAVGRDPFGSRFATGNQAEELAARGFKPGLGPAGSFNLGWYNGGPYGGHTAGTLPDGTNVEMGGARGDGQVGGMAAGAADSMFTDHAHLPPEFFLGGDPNVSGGAGGGSFAGMPSGSVGSGGSLSGGGGGGGATGIGGTFGGGNAGEVKIAGGDAQPVWVTNWPASGGSFSAPVDPMATDGAQMNSTSIADVAPPDSAPLGGGSVDEQYQGPTGEDVGAIGTDFAKANVDQFLSDLGLSSSPGGLLGGLIAAVDELRPIVEEHVHYHVDSAREAVREHTSAQREKALGYNTGRRG
ncbi:hypothetical protein [Rhodococcoides fascians]|uniref:hypothetical protein n=1 Tax=Rhodococcoides fascians TaxID=1828 RepID=UPI000564768E|nr:hypothetical protein [Rhodococcus fascians]